MRWDTFLVHEWLREANHFLAWSRVAWGHDYPSFLGSAPFFVSLFQLCLFESWNRKTLSLVLLRIFLSSWSPACFHVSSFFLSPIIFLLSSSYTEGTKRKKGTKERKEMSWTAAGPPRLPSSTPLLSSTSLCAEEAISPLLWITAISRSLFPLSPCRTSATTISFPIFYVFHGLHVRKEKQKEIWVWFPSFQIDPLLCLLKLIYPQQLINILNMKNQLET